jgi:hypothetical protein
MARAQLEIIRDGRLARGCQDSSDLPLEGDSERIASMEYVGCG